MVAASFLLPPLLRSTIPSCRLSCYLKKYPKPAKDKQPDTNSPVKSKLKFIKPARRSLAPYNCDTSRPNVHLRHE